MLRFLTLFAFSLLIFTVSSPARAEMQRYEFDKAHTQILFFSDHMGFSQSEGRFMDFDGYFDYNDGDPAASDVNVTIKTASIDMGAGNDRWNTHLKSEEFFNSEKYPDMTFKSTAIKLTGDNTADITGDLTLLGQTHPVVLHVTHNKSGANPMSGKHVEGFTATATLDRTQWGMTYGVPMMDPNINIRITVEASPVSEQEGAGNK